MRTLQVDPPAGFWSVLRASRCVAGSGAAAGGKAFREGERRPHVEISVEMQSSSGTGSPTRGAGRSVSISLEPGEAGEGLLRQGECQTCHPEPRSRHRALCGAVTRCNERELPSGENNYLLIKERADARGLTCLMAYHYSC